MHPQLIWAITKIKNFRRRQELPPLSSAILAKSAVLYLIQKGHFVPVYKMSDSATQLQRNESIFPWDPQDKREFWCDELGAVVKLTGDLLGDGTYYVKKLSDPSGMQFPVRGKELVLRDLAEKPELESDSEEYLKINKSSWGNIKNFIITKFINHYNWQGIDGKSPSEIRKEMVDFVKLNRNGLARLIDVERRSERGYFSTRSDLISRMSAIHPEFPWEELALLFDYEVPRT